MAGGAAEGVATGWQGTMVTGRAPLTARRKAFHFCLLSRAKRASLQLRLPASSLMRPSPELRPGSPSPPLLPSHFHITSSTPHPPSTTPPLPPRPPCSSSVLTSYSLIRSVPKASSYLSTFALPQLSTSLLFHQNLSCPLHTFRNNVQFDEHLPSKLTKWSFCGLEF